MPKRFPRSTLVLCLALMAAVTATARVSITQEEGKLRIEIDGRHFADYVYQGYSRPFLYPIIGPHGAKMTRNWPIAEGANEEKDHPHHKSFWWGHGDMNGVDFWAEGRNSGKTVHEKFTTMKSGAVGVITSRNKYVANDGTVVCTDERTLRFYGDKEQPTFDFQITLFAGSSGLTFGDTKEGTMALRLAETMRLKGKVGKGHIVNSEGIRDGQTWGKRAKWVDYYGPVEDRVIDKPSASQRLRDRLRLGGDESSTDKSAPVIVGIAIFDHPSNPRHPTWWHVRDYGLFAANPFGIHDFEKKEKRAGELKVAPGDTITFNYRFYLHSGDEKEGKVSEAYERYAQGKNP